MSEEVKNEKNLVADSNTVSKNSAKDQDKSSADSGSARKPFYRNNRDQRDGFRKGGRNGFSKRGGFGKDGKRGSRNNRRNKNEEKDEFDSQIIQVKRVTRVVKGGKRMRFAALVVVGDKKGKVGFGLKKGMDFQESVMKATRQAKNNLLNVNINDSGSVDFPSMVKYKSTTVMIKPADQGTGLISGGFVRPVLELAGLKNVYTKIVGSNNKTSGVQTVFEALKQYSK